jgi:TonB family protein
LRRAGITGDVTVRLAVGPDGTVLSSSIIKSSSREFEASVLTATKSWLFRTLPDAQPFSDKRLVIDCQIKFTLAE